MKRTRIPTVLLSIALIGSGAIGSSAIAQTVFPNRPISRQAGIEMLHVPYKGNAPALIDVIGGQISMLFDQISTSLPHIRSGKLRALGVSTLTRAATLPDVPTISESAQAFTEYLHGEARKYATLAREAGIKAD